MSARFVVVCVVGLAIAPALTADEPKIAPVSANLVTQPADALSTLLEKLHGQEVELPSANVKEIPLLELLQQLGKAHDLTFAINDQSFKSVGIGDIKDSTPNLTALQVRGLTVHQFLSTIMGSMGATYMIKGKTIEIVTPAYAARAARAGVYDNEDGRQSLKEPLVSAVFKEKPLNEAIAAIAERYDLTAIVSPQAGDGRAGFITARLLNVPADRALELLAVQADLRVVRKGAAYLITSREHADGMFQEGIEKERAKIELEKFRQMPPPRPEAPQPQPKPDRPVLLKLDVVPQLKLPK